MAHCLVHLFVASLVVVHAHSIPLICPDGYAFQRGDAVGRQWAIEVKGRLFRFLSSVRSCGHLCDKTDNCKAFEWSPSKQICVLINTTSTNGPKFEDYNFCSNEKNVLQITKWEQKPTTTPKFLKSPAPLPRGGRSKKSCHCLEITVSSATEENKAQREAFGAFRITDSSNLLDRVAFGSTVYQNIYQLTLLGGRKQHWRIQNWKRESLLRNKKCKEECPSDCTSDWEIYETGKYYVKVKDLLMKCREEPSFVTTIKDIDEGSGIHENDDDWS